jgi:hypothetical protein
LIGVRILARISFSFAGSGVRGDTLEQRDDLEVEEELEEE